MKSIIQSKKECFLCRRMAGEGIELTSYGLEEHHCIPGTANRKKSEQYGLKVWLCHEHHRTGIFAVHRSTVAMMGLKQIAQEKFEETHSREEFIKEFGRSYL